MPRHLYLDGPDRFRAARFHAADSTVLCSVRQGSRGTVRSFDRSTGRLLAVDSLADMSRLSRSACATPQVQGKLTVLGDQPRLREPWPGAVGFAPSEVTGYPR